MSKGKKSGHSVVLCGDPGRLLDLVARELFPDIDEVGRRLTGNRLLRRVRELAIDEARLSMALETSRYAPPVTDERTGHALSVVDRCERLVVEHTALVDRWTETERQLASTRRQAGLSTVYEVEEGVG